MSDYIFPNFLAKAMAKIDFRTQLEAAMMSMTLILLGIIVSALYLILYVHGLALWYKIFLVINAGAAFIFLSSMIITTYQQYKSYMETIEFQKQMKGGQTNNAEKKESRRGRRRD